MTPIQSIDEFPLNQPLALAIEGVEQYLREFATSPEFIDKMRLAFGESFEAETALNLAQAWQNEDFSVIPTIEFLSSEQLNGANGAYAAATGKIYLSEKFFTQHQDNSAAIVNLLLEEIGHRVDGLLNTGDSAGDEGAIFSALVQRESLSSEQLQQLKAENDRAVITLDGQAVEIEQQNFTGNAGNDNIPGTPEDDFIQGLEGNDNLYGEAGNDTLIGGDGDDYLDPGTGVDSIDGGAGNDGMNLDLSTITDALTINYTNPSNGTVSNGTVFQNIESFNIRTGSGNDNVNLTAATGNAWIRGNAGNDTLQGGAGVDRIEGGDGDDIIRGGVGNDNDSYTGYPGATNYAGLDGGAGNDQIFGEAGNDNLYGEAGNDTLIGGDGDDYLDPGTGVDSIDGGAGNDGMNLDLSTITDALTINYTNPSNGTVSNGTVFQNIESFNIRTGSGNDNVNLTAATGNAWIRGNAGNDTLQGGAGVDRIEGGDGDDIIRGGVGNDNDSYTGYPGATNYAGLDGGAGNDQIFGEAGNDNLYGEAGNDTLIGGDGDDYLDPGTGVDSIDGGAGNDGMNLDLSTITDALTINYTNPSNGTVSNGTVFQNIESFNIRTGSGNDNVNLTAATGNAWIRGNAGNDTLQGGAGVDRIEGGDGDDIIRGGVGNDNDSYTGYPGATNYAGLDGGAGNDQIFGEAGNDNLYGEAGNDTLIGGDGDDYLDPGTGVDSIDGGAGNDGMNLDLSTITDALTINYTNPSNGTVSNGTVFQNIESFNIRTGSGNDNVNLTAATGNAWIRGNAGNDTLQGGAGVDRIEGGDGDDIIRGGVGNDNDSYTGYPGATNYAGLDGGAGNDQIFGEAGNDNLYGEAGNDTLIGGDGDDYLDPGTGVDSIDGGAGNDGMNLDLSTITDALTINYTNPSNGTVSNGTVFQNIESFNIRTGSGNDNVNLTAATGNAWIRGNAGNDTLQGGAGVDRIEGGDGDDIIRGGVGNDNDSYTGYPGATNYAGLDGGAGNDTLIGVNPNSSNPGIGERDNLSGGTGSDRFILGDTANIYYDDRNTSTNGNNDYATITDFNPLEDTIQLKGSASDYRLELSANGNYTNLYIDKPGSEPDELIAILNNISGLTSNSPAFVYVKPSSELQFSASNFSINENGATVIPVVIIRSGENQGAVSVTLTPSNGTATTPADYNNAPIVVNFASGETSKTVNIPIINDSLQEGNETITLTLSNATGGAVLGSRSTATLTVIDDDVLTPDYAGNSLSTARDISILNGTQNFSDYVDAVDKDDYYRFQLLKNSTFNLTLNGLSANANVELINSAGVVIASSIASGTTAETINQTLNAGVYYIRVYPQTGQTKYNLAVKGTPIATPFQINSVTPDAGSNAGQVTLTIKGNQFTNAAAVKLIAPNNTTRSATNVIWQDDTTLIATFNLAGLTADAYDVQVTDTAGTATKNDIFNVNTTGQGQLEAYLNVTPRLRPWNIGEVTVTYKNTGNSDIPAPLFSITLLSQSSLAKFIGTDPKIFTAGIVGANNGGSGGVGGSINLPSDLDLKAADTATFWGSGNQGDASTLSPGETGTYKIYFSPAPGGIAGGGRGGGGVVGFDPQKAVGGISFSLNVIPPGSSNNPIDWNAIKDSSRPNTIPVDAWNVIYNNLITALGNTADSYQKIWGKILGIWVN